MLIMSWPEIGLHGSAEHQEIAYGIYHRPPPLARFGGLLTRVQPAFETAILDVERYDEFLRPTQVKVFLLESARFE